jgi:cbb3-type cytochrome oxidase subunit 3
MLAVMHLYASRIMCHDDIRAIRKVYGLSVKRENAKYDDTCRRDFPLNKLQKIMYKIDRWIIFYGFRIGVSISFIIFLLTIIYIMWKKRPLNRNRYSETSTIQSNDSEQVNHKHYKTTKNAFLWHDDYLNG